MGLSHVILKFPCKWIITSLSINCVNMNGLWPFTCVVVHRVLHLLNTICLLPIWYGYLILVKVLVCACTVVSSGEHYQTDTDRTFDHLGWHD